ncbi:ROK family protein [Plebeiibacterium sediminum]|uniref:ROK family protein n=1 Tax=Plebeiibacterium sediminum TaxID=2992112 RepID=A0AAE3SDZ9_9BACT|nr:ROK family protein [Plebeiobacterium sediminum]MCW3785983.1 ROK family protein [Plebeiobacterium sediminum]
MKYNSDHRYVATLDAGGTNFVFSAIQGNEEVVRPIRKTAIPDNLDQCLNVIKNGFEEVIQQLPEKPVALSFAFPGPADYANGIIGDLPNFPSFKGGVPLGPFLENEFNIPVFINNDGSLFAYGEALAGALSDINRLLKEKGSSRGYNNLLGVTLGTGFGGGAVVNQELVLGDNACGGDVWVFRNKKYPKCIVEESVSKRAVTRVYKELSGDSLKLTPEEIYKVAQGLKAGDREAAVKSFEELGEMAGDTIAMANTIIDGIVVIGGGLSGAYEYILPAMVKELNHSISTLNGEVFPRSQAQVYNLMDKEQLDLFLQDGIVELKIPGSHRTVPYMAEKKTGIVVSKLGASKAISLGAYAYALHQIDSMK